MLKRLKRLGAKRFHTDSLDLGHLLVLLNLFELQLAQYFSVLPDRLVVSLIYLLSVLFEDDTHTWVTIHAPSHQPPLIESDFSVSIHYD